MKKKTAMALWGGLAATALLLAGCSSSGPTGTPAATKKSSVVTQAEINKAMNTPTTLTYWSWASFITPEVAQFEQKYPKIKVNLVNVGVAQAEYTKLTNAISSGTGAPDLAMVDYSYIPEFVLGNDLADFTPYGGAKLESDYTSATWKSLTTADGQLVGLPQNADPMVFFYRSDLFNKAGISEAPKTWDEFLTDASTLKSKTGADITSIDPGDPGLILGLLQQAAAGPFTYDGKKTVGIDLTSAKAKTVADFLTKLVQSGDAGIEPALTTDWYQSLANSKYGGWLQAASGQNNLINTLPQQSGQWAIGATPQLSAGDNVNGSIGGSATVILKGSKNKIAAYELASFLFNNPTIVAEGANKAFPAVKSVLASDAFIQNASPYFGNQQANKVYADQWQAVKPSSGSLPFMGYAYTVFDSTVGQALTSGTNVYTAFKQWQSQLVSYAKQQGFTVKQ
jgi:multiple sugar transport system substrate-binding protein